MRQRFLAIGFAGVLALAAAAPAPAADDYAIDAVHSSVTFKIQHLGISWIHGRFDDVAGGFTINPDDAGKCLFALSLKADSIDTNSKQRDEHLRSPDFFNVKQFPTISFKSTAVKAIKDGGYEVTGDLTLHGVTKPVTFQLTGGKKAEFPKGTQRTGFSTELTIKHSDFGMDKFAEALSDEVVIAISFEGTKK
jgi:polyisoprenoid-binding protein YceI